MAFRDRRPRSFAGMKRPNLTILASFAPAAALAAAALWAAPVKADPLSDFLGGVFGAADHFPGAGKMVAPRHRHARRAAPRAFLPAPAGGRSMIASYYGGGERLAARTASGEPFRPAGFTAAHRTLPFGARLTVCLHGCVIVRVNDRGPAAWTGRALDLSRGAASAIGMTRAGVARVRVAIGG